MPRTKKVKPSEEKIESTSLKKTSDRPVEKKSSLSIPVYDITGVEKKRIELPKEFFSLEANPSLLAQYVRVYLANQRQGTASAKTRGDVVGSTRKIYRQKGTGRARHGDIKAPIFVGGGVVGGPKPRDYSKKISKKQKRIALFLALTLKQKENAILAAEDITSIEPKTKLVAHFLSKIGLTNKKILFILPKMEKNNFILASRNISRTTFTDAVSLNPYGLLQAEKIVFVHDALSVLEKHFLEDKSKQN